MECALPPDDLKVRRAQASADQDAPIAEVDGVDGDGDGGAANGDDEGETHEEGAEEDQIIEDLLFEDPASPPAYRAAAAPVRPKKTPSLFHPSRKRPAPQDATPAAPRATKVPRTKTWTNTVRAASPRPRDLTQGWAKRTQQQHPAARRGKKMEYRSDRIAKPLQPHVPVPSEVRTHWSAADTIVEGWVESLLDFFELNNRVAETPSLPRRREDVAVLDKAIETVEHMAASVKSMKVEVLEVSTVVD